MIPDTLGQQGGCGLIGYCLVNGLPEMLVTSTDFRRVEYFSSLRRKGPTRVPHRRLAIRAARFGPEAECLPWEVGEKTTAREFHSLKKNEGPLRGQ
jgi:hypothetical protein